MIPSWVAVVTGISLAILALAAIAIALSSVIAVLALRTFLRILEHLAGPAVSDVRQLVATIRTEAESLVGTSRELRAAPGRSPRLDAGHARLPRRVGAGEPAPAVRRRRRPAAGVPLRLPVRQHRGRHLPREEVRPGRAALSRLARGPGDLRSRADRSAARLRARLPLSPGSRRRGPQLFRAPSAGPHVEYRCPGPQLLGEPLRDPPGRRLRERGEGADPPGSHAERHASRHHHFAHAVQRPDQSPAVSRDGAPV